MRRNSAWSGGLLLLLAGAALWMLRGPDGLESAPPGSASTGPGASELTPDATNSAGLDGAPAGSANAPGPSDPGSERAAAPAPPNVRGPGELAATAGSWSWLYRAPGPRAATIQKETWKKYVEPLVYPEGHPKAGAYREGVTLQEVVEARLQYARATFPGEEIDRPYHYIVKRISYASVSELAKGWVQSDPASGDQYAQRLREAPVDPGSKEQTLWIPATPAHPQAVTTAEFIEKQLVSLEIPAFMHPRR